MKLEEQVVNFELAKQLKTLDVKQDSLFYYCRIRDLEEDYIDLLMQREITNKENNYCVDISCSAFTVAELGEMLPLLIIYSFKYSNDDYRIWNDDVTFSEETEIITRAKMLIYLLSNDCNYDDLNFLKWRNSITNKRKMVRVK